MTYADLYNAVYSLVSGKFCIEVNTWSTRQGPETTWEIYIADSGQTFEGPTAQDAFDAFDVYARDPESLNATSAAVGKAV